MASDLRNGIWWVARQTADPTPDGELLSRFLTSRDEAAFAELVRRHGRVVLAACRRVLGHAADADDAFQAAFVVLVRKAHALTSRPCVGSFLYATAVLTARKARTMATRRRANEAKAVRPEAAGPPGTDEELTRVLDDVLAGLPAKYREPVVLCELEGVSRREAAARLGIPEGTISSRLATAHRMLAKRLAARGFAAVAVAAVLGERASAVPRALADASVRAAADIPPAAVTQLVSEVTKMLLWEKLRSGVTALAGVVLLLGVGLMPTGGPGATAAPVPKAKDDGLIWTLNTKTNALTAYTPDGKEARTVKLPQGVPFFGFTPDGGRMAFGGKDGKGSKDADGMTLHVGAVGEKCEGVDTGLKCQPDDRFVWSPDATRVVRVRLEKPGPVLARPGAKPSEYSNTLYDLAGRKETAVTLPVAHKVMGWSADGKAWRVMHTNGNANGNLPFNRWLTTPAGGTGELTPVCDAASFYDLAPDGAGFVGVGWKHPPDESQNPKALFRVADGKVTVLAEVEGGELLVNVFPAPDGRRVVVTRLESDGSRKAFMDTAFVLFDADGKNETRVVRLAKDDQTSRLLGWFPSPSPPPDPKGKPLVATVGPVPKGEPVEDGLIWTYNHSTGELTAYTPAGEKAKTLKLKDGRRLLGITPDGSKLAFLGKEGRLAAADADKDNPGLSIHLRDIGEGTEGVDTGIAYTPRDQFVWSPDGKKVVRVGFRSKKRPFKVGTLASDIIHSLVEIETKKETPLGLGHDQEQVMGWSPDGTWLLTKQFTRIVGRGDAQYFLTDNHRFDLATSASTPLGAKVQLAYLSFSPDGRSMVGTSIESPGVVAGQKDRHVVRVDVATGESTEIARHEDQSPTHTRWAPSGKRVAYLWHKPADKSEAFLSIIDPDGKNPKTVTIPAPDETANEVAILGWFPDKPVAKPPTDEKSEAGKKSEEPKKDEPMNEKAKKPEDAEQILGDRQEWKSEFLKVYGLKDGELVKRIAPPYPDCRTDYFRDQFRRIHGRKPAEFELEGELNNFTVFNWKDGTCKAGWQTHTEPHVGVSLGFVFDTVLGISKSRIEVDGLSLNDKVTGDFVVRVGADREKMTAQLEPILRKEVELPLKFTFKEVEEEVFVLSGKYAAKPLEDRKADEIEVYAVRLIDRTVGGGGSGDFQFMIDAIERHTGRPILLDKIDGLPKAVRWHFNFSQPANKQMEAQERDAATLLDNVAAQTGLMVKPEKRKLRKLVVEYAELKK